MPHEFIDDILGEVNRIVWFTNCQYWRGSRKGQMFVSFHRVYCPFLRSTKPRKRPSSPKKHSFHSTPSYPYAPCLRLHFHYSKYKTVLCVKITYDEYRSLTKAYFRQTFLPVHQFSNNGHIDSLLFINACQ